MRNFFNQVQNCNAPQSNDDDDIKGCGIGCLVILVIIVICGLIFGEDYSKGDICIVNKDHVAAIDYEAEKALSHAAVEGDDMTFFVLMCDRTVHFSKGDKVKVTSAGKIHGGYCMVRRLSDGAYALIHSKYLDKE